MSPIITSVVRKMLSNREWRQPRTLLNIDFSTQSFASLAGKGSPPFAAILLSASTPVVVSSFTRFV
eukprot:11585009-Heterocapsa_arctica.AAC.1